MGNLVCIIQLYYIVVLYISYIIYDEYLSLEFNIVCINKSDRTEKKIIHTNLRKLFGLKYFNHLSWEH